MFLNDSARVKILLLVLMSEIKKNDFARGKKSFLLCVFFQPTRLAICTHCTLSICIFYLFPILVLMAGFSF